MFSSGSLTSNSSEDPLNKELNLSDNSGTIRKYKFPPAPRLVKSVTNSYCSTASDSSNYQTPLLERSYVAQKKKRRRPHAKRMPPLGIYWDIENCQVPKNKSASSIVQRIREVFLEGYRESEFIVVCDIKKENPQVVEELHDSQVLLIHVSSLSKNAADEKLRQSLRRFGELHSPPAGVVLISGDVNFAADLSDLRYRKKIKVTLIHNVNVADALILCANEHHSFMELMKAVPPNTPSRPKVSAASPSFLTVANLPPYYDPKRLKQRLRMLINNCGGKIVKICTEDGSALIRFSNADTALRAQRRIQGEDVFGRKTRVFPSNGRNYTNRKVKSCDISHQHEAAGLSTHPPEGNKQVQNAFSDNYMFKPINDSTYMETSLDSNWSNGYQSGRRSLTPQDLLNMGNLPSDYFKIGEELNYTDDRKVNYKNEGDGKVAQPVNLIISNLDPSLEIKEIKKLLTYMIEKYAEVINLNITIQPEGGMLANVLVGNQQQAQLMISQLHRQKLGHKRIVISYAQNNSMNPNQLKAIVIEILQGAPDRSMPLFKFITLLNTRYHCAVSVSEINKLKDVCKINNDSGARIITLIQQHSSFSSSDLNKIVLPYCTIHSFEGIQNTGWGESSIIELPSVMISLKDFTAKLDALLGAHGGSMPLLSFQSCYEQEFDSPLPVDDSGVPLEHLIACVPNVEIKQVMPKKNVKIIQYSESKTKGSETEEEAVLKSISPSLTRNVSLLCRELVELLRSMDKCQLSLGKFSPTYHHHFSRQCRVADYGFTKILDLFESIPHVIQVMGDSNHRVITLSHNAQMRRFTSDLLKVLKLQPARQININSFPSAYEKIMNRPFNAVDYGLCTLNDLLQEVPKNIIVFSKTEEDITVVSIPKREQTQQEIVKTEQFGREVIDLLRHSPYYSIPFKNFVPAYHHHFGHQCKVSDYGFTKLIELFEAIPDVTKIEELKDGEKMIRLTVQQSLNILCSQIIQLLKAVPQCMLPLVDLPRFYIREYGYPLKPQVYECESVRDIVSKLSDYVQIVEGDAGPLLVAIDMDTVPEVLKVRFWGLLLNPPHCKDVVMLRYQYQTKYKSNFSMDGLQHIKNVIAVSSVNNVNYISLTALYVLAAQLYSIVYKNGGSILFSNLEKLYQYTYGAPLNLSNFKINTMEEFYSSFGWLFFNNGNKKKITLNKNLAEHFIPLPSSNPKCQENVEEKRAPSLASTSFNWPPPPFDPEMMFLEKVSPPKPDTPPSPASVMWHNWNAASADGSLNISVQLPAEKSPKLPFDMDTLLSKQQQSVINKTVRKPTRIPRIWAPDPTELPMPNQLIPKGESKNESTDFIDSGLSVTVNKVEPVPTSSAINASSTARQLFAPDQQALFPPLLNFYN